MYKDKYLDKLVSILCVIGLVVEFFTNYSVMYVLGLVGLVYCLYYLYIGFLCPIKRDWILAKGHFLIKVVNFVLLVPFVVVSLLQVVKIVDDLEGITPQGFFYEDGLYPQTSENAVQEEISKLDSPSLFWTVYYHFIDPGNQHMTTSELGRKGSALIAILGFLLLNGLLISTLISWFDRRREHWINGEIRYGNLAFGKHSKLAVVIGANEAAPTIIRKLLRGNGIEEVQYVILLTNENVDNVREKIASYLTEEEEQRIVIYNGQLDSIEEIDKLNLEKATEVYVLGESSNDDVSQSYHDTQNMRCVHNIASCLEDKCEEKQLLCWVLFEYQTTYSVFQFSDLPNNIRKHLVFIPFNVYENWAQCVLVEGKYIETIKRFGSVRCKYGCTQDSALSSDRQRTIEYMPLDGTGISPTSKERVHLVVVGMSKMGIAMAIQAAQVAHYPNFSTGRTDKQGRVLRGPSEIRTRITLIDENADNEKNFFMGRFQHLFALARHRYIDASNEDCDVDVPWNDPMHSDGGDFSKLGENFIDIEWEFVKGNVQSPGVMKYLKDAAKRADNQLAERSLMTVAICHPLAHEAIAAAMYMPGEIYDNALQILVYQREASDIVYNLSNKDNVYENKRYAKLRPFGMLDSDFTMNNGNYYRSLLCNYVYMLLSNGNTDDEQIKRILAGMDISQKEEKHMQKAREGWKALSIFNKWSNRYLSNSFETKLRSIGALFDSIEQHYEEVCYQMEHYKQEMEECEHNRWNVQQLLMGFRAYNNEELATYQKLKTEVADSEDAKIALKEFKQNMKRSPEKVHLNICSIAMMEKLDQEAMYYDEALNAAIPSIMRCIERHQKNCYDNKKLC